MDDVQQGSRIDPSEAMHQQGEKLALNFSGTSLHGMSMQPPAESALCGTQQIALNGCREKLQQVLH